jgi:hypothetical protein
MCNKIIHTVVQVRVDHCIVKDWRDFKDRKLADLLIQKIDLDIWHKCEIHVY